MNRENKGYSFRNFLKDIANFFQHNRIIYVRRTMQGYHTIISRFQTKVKKCFLVFNLCSQHFKGIYHNITHKLDFIRRYPFFI